MHKASFALTIYLSKIFITETEDTYEQIFSQKEKENEAVLSAKQTKNKVIVSHLWYTCNIFGSVNFKIVLMYPDF